MIRPGSMVKLSPPIYSSPLFSGPLDGRLPTTGEMLKGQVGLVVGVLADEGRIIEALIWCPTGLGWKDVSWLDEIH